MIGGGLAGILAAVAAARAGATVTLVSRAPGATALSMGGVDLLPSWPLASGAWRLERPTLAARWARLQREEPEHPLAAAGCTLEDLVEAARFLREHLLGAPLAWRGPEEPPFLLPTERGTLREIDLAPAVCEAGDLSRVDLFRVGVVGLPELPSFDPGYLAVALADRLQTPDGFVPLLPELRFGEGCWERPVALARALEADQGELLCQALTELAQGQGLTHLLLPPVLGLSGSPGLLARLRAGTGLAVFEPLAVNAPCPGLRLHHALHDLAEAFGVRRLLGQVDAYELADDGRQVVGLRISTPPETTSFLACQEVVLATGGLYGGGLVWSGQPQEALLGLPVVAGPGRAGHHRPTTRPLAVALADDPTAPSAVFGAGVACDLRQLPLDRQGLPAFRNVRVCGGLLAGHDAGARRGGSGIALVTGWRAGRLAAGGEEAS
ncbi:MAG: FAD-binding protein [Myxococcota bacterium]|nr:FAD-binding protein [Myxococcota bacterium]